MAPGSTVSRTLSRAALATGLIAGTTFSVVAQNNVATYFDFFWQNYSQSTCVSRGEAAIHQAVGAFGIEGVETRTTEWNVLANTPDFNFWVFCIADADGLLDETTQRVLTIALVASGRPDIDGALRDYLVECMEGACPVITTAAETIDWSTNAISYRDGATALIDLVCPALGNDSFRPVWGTDIYTDDSSICTAAVHAGAITTAGGAVTIEMTDGQASYDGTQRNGVSTANWGNYPSSFRFVSGGKG